MSDYPRARAPSGGAPAPKKRRQEETIARAAESAAGPAVENDDPSFGEKRPADSDESDESDDEWVPIYPSSIYPFSRDDAEMIEKAYDKAQKTQFERTSETIGERPKDVAEDAGQTMMHFYLGLMGNETEFYDNFCPKREATVSIHKLLLFLLHLNHQWFPC